jgi:hypothetical protein
MGFLAPARFQNASGGIAFPEPKHSLKDDLTARSIFAALSRAGKRDRQALAQCWLCLAAA